jgi:hypothetical protein
MDRYPADGVQVLRDGTLATWLEEEGALHLAALARGVVLQPKSDARIALEMFLAGTGYIARPPAVAKPTRLDLGYVAQGQRAARRLRLEKPRGVRGYLFGSASGGDHWLRVEPREFGGSPAEFVVSVDASELRVSGDPYLSNVFISDNSPEQMSVPVTLRVVVEPPAFIRRVVRPVAGLLAGALLGAALGFLARVSGLAQPEEMRWAVIALALVWGLAGFARAWSQPPAWPLRYGLRRWLAKVAAWSAGLALLAVVIAQAWRLGLGGGLQFEGLTVAAAAVGGAVFGFAPATLDELAQGRHARDPEYVWGRPSVRRPALIGAGLVALVLVALMTPRLVNSALNESGVRSTLQTGQGWAEQRLNDLGAAMDGLIERATLRYYDRPAGVVGGTPTPEGPLFKLPEALTGD